jgi:hypothetical protein
MIPKKAASDLIRGWTSFRKKITLQSNMTAQIGCPHLAAQRILANLRLRAPGASSSGITPPRNVETTKRRHQAARSNIREFVREKASVGFVPRVNIRFSNALTTVEESRSDRSAAARDLGRQAHRARERNSRGNSGVSVPVPTTLLSRISAVPRIRVAPAVPAPTSGGLAPNRRRHSAHPARPHGKT